jgi:hypothetical protein
MGCFSYTCALSALPIEAGDKVRYLLLSQSPYEQTICTMNGAWFARTFPIKAAYNEYGSVEDVEEGIGKDLWMEGLKIDLVSVGLGENTCHDIPTSKDMSFDDMLGAIVEHRLKVKRSTDLHDKRKDLYKTRTPVGVPTMQRIRKLLNYHGFNIVGQGFTEEGYIVDKLKYGKIRVRFSTSGDNWGKDEQFLKLVQPCLKEYVTVIVAGQGSNVADLLVYPKPGIKDWHGVHSFSAKPTLQVDHAMIREDVWQEIINTPLTSDWSDKVWTIQDYYLAITKTYTKYQEVSEECSELYKDSPVKDMIQSTMIEYKFRELADSKEWESNPLVYWLTKGDIPYVISIAENWKLLTDKKLPLDEVKAVLYDIAEFIYVMHYMMSLRFYWRPSNSCGPQEGLWKNHKKFLKSLLKISNKAIVRRKAYDDIKRDSKGRFCK